MPSLSAPAGATSKASEIALAYKAFAGPAFNYVRLNLLLERVLRVVTIAWAGFVCFSFLRTYFDCRGLSRLISSGRPIPRKHNYKRRYVARLTVLARRMGIQRTVLLMESTLVDVPSVVGWFKPIVLVPIAFLGSMPPDHVEAILAHELGHVRRCDYLVNLLQIVIETLLFYHPAVQWISRVIRDERENCCDDLAVAMISSRQTYVSALTTLAERNLFLSAAAMAADGGCLIKRARRVLGVKQAGEVWGIVFARHVYLGILLGAVMIGLSSAASFTVDHSSVAQHLDKVFLTKALVSSASTGDIPAIESLLQKGAEIDRNVPPTAGNALIAAATHDQYAAVELLLQKGASVDAKNEWGMRAMDWALATGNFPMAKLLHDDGAYISPVAWAAAAGDMEQLKGLTADNVATSNRMDDLMQCAVCMGHLEVVQFLEKLQRKPVEGKFLADAASAGNVPMMAYLLAHGAKMQTNGAKAMEQIVLFYDRPEAAKFLLLHGADPNQLTRTWGKYLLTGAQSAAMIKVLLEAGANPNCEDHWGTPLSAAPDAESVRLLVHFGAKLDPVLESGISLIESAIMHDRYDKPDVVRELIKLGAPFDPNGNGVRAMALAAAKKKVKTMEALLDLGVSPNAFLNTPYWRTSIVRSAVRGASIDALKFLLEQGGTASGDPHDDLTPSASALLSGNSDLANLLRNGGARDLGELSLAASSGDLSEVSYLVATGADVNQKDQTGRTPLFYARQCGQTQVARYLISHGAIDATEKASPDIQ